MQVPPSPAVPWSREKNWLGEHVTYGTAVLCPSYPTRPPLCQHWVQRDEGGYSGSVIQAPAQHTHTHTPQYCVEPGPGTHTQKHRHCAKDRGHRLRDWSWVQVTLGGRKKRKRRCMVTGMGFTQIKNQNFSEAPKSCQKEAS